MKLVMFLLGVLLGIVLSAVTLCIVAINGVRDSDD